MKSLVLWHVRLATLCSNAVLYESHSYQFYIQVQSLSAKYDERCKKVGDVASKLTMDEATFREIQVYL